ncbi:hypothetical protein [Nonomuraea dietziae]|uniref:hypothetical protein n=1 Tax=Nonomuraea dietziae TaxID=65515 RepID=UPI0031D044FA
MAHHLPLQTRLTLGHRTPEPSQALLEDERCHHRADQRRPCNVHPAMLRLAYTVAGPSARC